MRNRMKRPRTRVTVSLPADLVDLIDRTSRELKETRSALVEEWLRQGASSRAQCALEAEITDYYSRQSAIERADDVAIARAAGRAAARLTLDEPQRRRSRR